MRRTQLTRVLAGGLTTLALVVAGCGDPVPTTGPTTPVVTSEAPTTPTEPSTPSEPTEPTEPSPAGGDFGAMPPKNIDALKTLQPAKFPEAVGAYALTKAEEDKAGAAFAEYEDAANFLAFGAVVDYGPQKYKFLVERMTDPAYQGNAVCGLNESSVKICVMAGTGEALNIRTADADTTLEQLGVLIQQLYDGL